MMPSDVGLWVFVGFAMGFAACPVCVLLLDSGLRMLDRILEGKQ
jgi:hypothetical protein